MSRKNVKPTQARLFDPRESTGYREAFRAVRATKKTSYDRDYYVLHRERILETQKKYQRRVKQKAKAREYYAQNREHICEMQRKSYAKKRREERLSKNFFGRILLRIERIVKG